MDLSIAIEILEQFPIDYWGMVNKKDEEALSTLIQFAEEAQKKIAVLDSPERWIMWCDEKMLTLNKELQAKIVQQTHDHEILVNSILEEKNKKIAELEDNHKVLTLLKEKNAKIAELEKQIQGQFKND